MLGYPDHGNLSIKFHSVDGVYMKNNANLRTIRIVVGIILGAGAAECGADQGYVGFAIDADDVTIGKRGFMS